MKSLNDILWDREENLGEGKKDNECKPMMHWTCLTDSCACNYIGGPIVTPFAGVQKMCTD